MKIYIAKILFYASWAALKTASLFFDAAHFINGSSDNFVSVSDDKSEMLCGHKMFGKELILFRKKLTIGFREFLKGQL